jgi:tryptophan 2,3-dioxygenase
VTTPYECYLRLPDLLSLQQPRTPQDQRAQWTDERLFIAVHQSAEVLAGQALADLRRADEEREAGLDRQAVVSLRRVTAVFDILEGHLALLDEYLDPESFAAFRPLLQQASGGQSSQFAELFGHIDARQVGSAVGVTAYGDGDQRDVVVAWTALQAALTRWKTRHLLLVERMIGDQPGTGGTSGLAYLRSRIELPPRDQEAHGPRSPGEPDSDLCPDGRA